MGLLLSFVKLHWPSDYLRFALHQTIMQYLQVVKLTVCEVEVGCSGVCYSLTSSLLSLSKLISDVTSTCLCVCVCAGALALVVVCGEREREIDGDQGKKGGDMIGWEQGSAVPFPLASHGKRPLAKLLHSNPRFTSQHLSWPQNTSSFLLRSKAGANSFIIADTIYIQYAQEKNVCCV